MKGCVGLSRNVPIMLTQPLPNIYLMFHPLSLLYPHIISSSKTKVYNILLLERNGKCIKGEVSKVIYIYYIIIFQAFKMLY